MNVLNNKTLVLAHPTEDYALTPTSVNTKNVGMVVLRDYYSNNNEEVIVRPNVVRDGVKFGSGVATLYNTLFIGKPGHQINGNERCGAIEVITYKGDRTERKIKNKTELESPFGITDNGGFGEIIRAYPKYTIENTNKDLLYVLTPRVGKLGKTDTKTYITIYDVTDVDNPKHMNNKLLSIGDEEIVDFAMLSHDQMAVVFKSGDKCIINIYTQSRFGIEELDVKEFITVEGFTYGVLGSNPFLGEPKELCVLELELDEHDKTLSVGDSLKMIENRSDLKEALILKHM